MPLLSGQSTFSKKANERFPRTASSLSILPVHIFRVHLQLSRLPDKSVHVAGHSRKDSGVLEFYEVIMLGDHS